MVTHRGTAQNDDTIQVAAEPAGGPRSEATLVSYATALAPTGSVPGCTLQCPMTDCAEWRGSLTIPSSAASEASPLQPVVRLSVEYPIKGRGRGPCQVPDPPVPADRCRGRRGSAGVPRALTVPKDGQSNAVRHPQCRSETCLEGSDAPRHDFDLALPDAARHERPAPKRRPCRW